MKSWILLCLFVMCYVKKGQGTFKDVLNQIPSDVAHAFDVAWTSLVDSIKTTVYTRRLGPASRRRTTARVSTSPQPSTPEYELKVVDISTRPSRAKPTLPVIPIPKFRSLKEWSRMQQPRFPRRKPISSDSTEDSLKYEAPTVNHNSFNTVNYNSFKESDESFYGPLIFI